MNFQKIILWICIWIFFPVMMQAQMLSHEQYLRDKGEVYFRFQAADRAQIEEAGRFISIDNVLPGMEIRAYANRKGFDRFLEKGWAFEVLPHPGDSPEPVPMLGLHQLKGVNDWNTYPTYDAYVQMMYDYSTDYPSLCQITQFGTSIQGRKLLMARVTSNINTGKPRFLYTATIHGDETGGYILTLRLIDYLLSNYGTDPRITSLVDNVEIYINPLANPDGTYKGGNSSVNGAIRYNANFVDLNRNFPDPADGPHPDGNAWQTETLAFMDLAEDYQFNISANYHGGAEVVNYPWDTWSRLHADNSWWVIVSNEYADTAQYYSPPGYLDDFGTGITNGFQWYRITGGRQDYMTYFQQGREFTLEISNTKLYPASQLPNLWEYNYRSMINYIEQSVYGITGIVSDSITGMPIKAMVFVKNHDIDSSMVFSRMPNGNYHRYIAAGTYTLEFSAPGYVSKTISGVQVQNYNTTNLDVQLRPVGVWANFSADQTQIQPGETVSFTDLSVGGPTQWTWSFPGAQPSSSILQNPQGIAYENEGVFDVELKAQNSQYSNNKTRKNFIRVGNQYLMSNQTLSVCSGSFYDEGGPNHPYAHNLNQITTFYPGETGKRIRLQFASFELESSVNCEKDYLRAYNGSSTSSPLMGSWCGTQSPGTLVADNEGGALTLEFVSNPFVNATGWVATVSCDSGVGIQPQDVSNIQVYRQNDGFVVLKGARGCLAEIYDLTGRKWFQQEIRKDEEMISCGNKTRNILLIRVTSASGVRIFKTGF